MRLERLTAGEWLAALAATLLLVDLLALPADGSRRAALADPGAIDLLLVLAALAGIAIWLVVAASDTPALPVAGTACAGLLVAVAALLASARALHEAGDTAFGGWLAVALAWLELAGLWAGLRDERLGSPQDPRDQTGARVAHEALPKVERLPAPPISQEGAAGAGERP